MKYISTRGGKPVSSGFAVLKGIAEDGGLYLPDNFPQLTDADYGAMLPMSYAARAAHILSKYFTDYDGAEIEDMCGKAYAKFENGEPAPIVKIDDNTYIMELWHGPTMAFKDVALTLLPYLMKSAEKKEKSGKKTLILVATSGDTGKAALEGFKDVEGTEIIVFYPSEGVSEMQKLQMQTSLGDNVHVVGINGNFDDAQAAVKSIFNDKEVMEELDGMGYAMSSANSINWGRLAPQIVYYISAYMDLIGAREIKEGDNVNFVVPTGNFGNILAGYYAKRMGLPIASLIIASNANNVLTDFFHTGKYDVNRPFRKTMSPSMDILVSSNLERLLFEAGGRISEFVKNVMRDLSLYGEYEIDIETLDGALSDFVAYWSDEEETAESIANFFGMFGYLTDTHTAVAVSAYYNYLSDTDDETKTVILATASPFKFAQDVLFTLTGKRETDAFRAVKKLESYTGEPAPEKIEELKNLEVRHTLVIPKEEIKNTVLEILREKN